MNPLLERSTGRIGEQVKFQHEENPPITFLGLAEDHNGTDTQQFNDSVPMSFEGHIEQMLKIRGWDKEHPESPKPC